MKSVRLGQTDYTQPLTAVWAPAKPHYFIASERAARGYERVTEACSVAAGIADLLRHREETPALRARLSYWAETLDRATRSGGQWSVAVANAQNLTGARVALQAALQARLDSYAGRTPKERSELACMKSWVASLRGDDAARQQALYAALPVRLRRLHPF